MHVAAETEMNPIIELNTTPLIDVMLVLLIMFIITIPLQTHAVKLDLPVGEARDVQPTVNLLEISRDGALLWNGSPISRQELRADLEASQQMTPVPELHLRPDAQARYKVVADVLGLIKREQVHRFAFVGNEAYRDW